MASDIWPLQVLASMKDTFPRPARPTALGPEYLQPESRTDSGSALQTRICHDSSCDAQKVDLRSEAYRYEINI